MNNLKPIPPFKGWVIQNFPFIEADFDAITNYQLLCKVVEYLNKVIANENELTTAMNYVLNYFNNLDVQEEIDNKLDKMAEDGTLAEIIAQYIDLQKIYIYENVESLKNSNELTVGSFARTSGYYSIGDGGEGFYYIRNITVDDVIDEGHLIAINGTLVAQLIINNNTLNVLQFGAKNDNTIDTTLIFNNIQNYADNIYIPKGEYKVNGTITYLKNNIKLYGDGIGATKLIVGEARRNQTIKANSVNNIYLGNLTIDTNEGIIEGALLFSGVQDSIIENVEFLNGHFTTMCISGNSSLYPSTQNGKNVIVRNCIAKGQKDFLPDGTASFIAGDNAENIIFENCQVIDCNSDGYDSDHSHNTKFINCSAISTDETINFYGFWSEGEQEETNVFFENCYVKGYAGGIGVSELVKANINNCIFDNITEQRSIWSRNFTNINNCTFKNCYKASETDGAILIEKQANIFNCKFLNDEYSIQNRKTSICIYSGAGIQNYITNISNCYFEDTQVQIGYANSSSKKINILNSQFYNSQIISFDTGLKNLLISNCIFNTDLDLNIISLARIGKSYVKNCNFICNVSSSKTAIDCSLDNFNLIVENSTFTGFNKAVNNTTYLLGNTTDTDEYNIFDYNLLRREIINVTDTNAYYSISVNTSKVGFIILKNENPDGARSIYAFGMTTYGAYNGILNKLIESPVYNSASVFDVTYNAGEPIKFKSPLTGNVEVIIIGVEK